MSLATSSTMPALGFQTLEVETVVDTTGAGDAFAAGFLLERDLVAAAQSAQKAAARCVARVGALP